MKKFFCLIISGCLFVLTTFTTLANGVQTSAAASILIAADSLDVICGKNINSRLSMASTTKIMTALILAEQENLSKTVKITKEMVMVEGSSMGLKVGDTVTYLDLIYGMLLASGNDAATATAYALGGGLDEFARMMNDKAKQIGLENTNFVTPSGLDDENHYSTAYDMAVLTAYALKNRVFKEVCSTYTKTLEIGGVKYTYQNHNRLLKERDDVIGVKTGFTKKSGRCLVTAAERDNVTLIAVTLSDGDDWNDHKNLLDYGFENVKSVSLEAEIPDSVAVISGDCDRVKVTAKEKQFTVFKASNKKLKAKVLLPRFIYSSVSAGETVGKIEYYFGDRLIYVSDILAVADVYIKNNKLPLRERFIQNLRKILRLVV